MLMTKFLLVDHVAETLTAIILEKNDTEGEKRAYELADELIKRQEELQRSGKKTTYT